MLKLAVAQLHYPCARLLLEMQALTISTLAVFAKINRPFFWNISSFCVLKVKYMYLSYPQMSWNYWLTCATRATRIFKKTTWILPMFCSVKTLWVIMLANSQNQTPCCYSKLFYKCNRPHFVGVYWYNKPSWDAGRTQEKFVNHSPPACDLQPFLFLCGFITPVNP